LGLALNKFFAHNEEDILSYGTKTSCMSKNKGKFDFSWHGPFNIEIFAAGVSGLSHGKYSWITCNRLKIIIQGAVFLEEVSALAFTMSSMCYKGYKYTIVRDCALQIFMILSHHVPQLKQKIINYKHICLHSCNLICWKLSNMNLLQEQHCNIYTRVKRTTFHFK